MANSSVRPFQSSGVINLPDGVFVGQANLSHGSGRYTPGDRVHLGCHYSSGRSGYQNNHSSHDCLSRRRFDGDATFHITGESRHTRIAHSELGKRVCIPMRLVQTFRSGSRSSEILGNSCCQRSVCTVRSSPISRNQQYYMDPCSTTRLWSMCLTAFGLSIEHELIATLFGFQAAEFASCGHPALEIPRPCKTAVRKTAATNTRVAAQCVPTNERAVQLRTR